MKKIVALTALLWFTIAFSALSQDSKKHKSVKTQTQIETDKSDDGKMHIKVEIEKDGKTTKVDTTINPEDLANLNEQLKDLDIHIESLNDTPDMHAFKFDWDQNKWDEQMKELEKQLQDKQLNSEDFQKQMEELREKMKDNHNMHQYNYMYNFDGDSDSDQKVIELEKDLDNLNNLNFIFDDNEKATIINGDEIKIDSANGKNEKQIIIKSRNKSDGKSKKHKESKKITIIMESFAGPEKQKAEFAAEPVKDEKPADADANRVRVVEGKGNPWLNELLCYPNPSSGQFTLSFRLSEPEAAELKIMDFAGREVLAENIPANTEWVEKQITLPSNSSAAYLLILRQGNNWHHEKIFVKSNS